MGKNLDLSIVVQVVRLVYQIPMGPAVSRDIQAETVIRVRI